MQSKSILSVFVVIAIAVISMCNINCLTNSENISNVLPKIWSNLAWNEVTLLEVTSNQFAEYKSLIIESSKQNINLKIRFLEKGQYNNEFLEKSISSKMTLISRCNNNHQDFEFFIKSRRPLSTLIAVTENCLTKKKKYFLKILNATTSFYFLDYER